MLGSVTHLDGASTSPLSSFSTTASKASSDANWAYFANHEIASWTTKEHHDSPRRICGFCFGDRSVFNSCQEFFPCRVAQLKETGLLALPLPASSLVPASSAYVAHSNADHIKRPRFGLVSLAYVVICIPTNMIAAAGRAAVHFGMAKPRGLWGAKHQNSPYSRRPLSTNISFGIKRLGNFPSDVISWRRSRVPCLFTKS